jgi:hypothetical protein
MLPGNVQCKLCACDNVARCEGEPPDGFEPGWEVNWRPVNGLHVNGNREGTDLDYGDPSPRVLYPQRSKSMIAKTESYTTNDGGLFSSLREAVSHEISQAVCRAIDETSDARSPSTGSISLMVKDLADHLTRQPLKSEVEDLLRQLR